MSTLKDFISRLILPEKWKSIWQYSFSRTKYPTSTTLKTLVFMIINFLTLLFVLYQLQTIGLFSTCASYFGQSFFTITGVSATPMTSWTFDKSTHSNPLTNTDETSATDRHLKFTLDLLHSTFDSLTLNQSPKSVTSFLVSPLSIQMVLMMMHLGARGQTRRELNACLHLSSSQDYSNAGLSEKQLTEVQEQQSNAIIHELFGNSIKNLLKDPNVSKAFTSANQIFLQKNIVISQAYESAIKRYYGAEVKSVDFHRSNQKTAEKSNLASTNVTINSDKQNGSVQQIINEWVERNTRGHIQNFISSPISNSTLMMAINVLFFKGEWKFKFDSSETQVDATFTKADGEHIKLPMMVGRLSLGFAYDPIMKTSMIELPYKAQRLGLFLVLPDDVSGIFHTMRMLNHTSFTNLISSMRKPPAHSNERNNGGGGINIRIPKFKIDASARLSHILTQRMNLRSLFSADSADLSRMFGNSSNTFGRRLSSTSNQRNNETTGSESIDRLQVGLDEFLHKTVFQIDEQGSVAAASSAILVERIEHFNNHYFEADHPFLMFLMDKQTGLVLFAGVFAGNSL